MLHDDCISGCLPARPPPSAANHSSVPLPRPLLQGKVILYSPKHIPRRNGPPKDLPLLEPTERQSHYYLLYRGTVRHRQGVLTGHSHCGHACRRVGGLHLLGAEEGVALSAPDHCLALVLPLLLLPQLLAAAPAAAPLPTAEYSRPKTGPAAHPCAPR